MVTIHEPDYVELKGKKEPFNENKTMTLVITEAGSVGVYIDEFLYTDHRDGSAKSRLKSVRYHVSNMADEELDAMIGALAEAKKRRATKV